MGGGSGPGSAQGFGTAGLSLGYHGLSGFLQTVAAAGHCGVGPKVHGTGRGAAAVGGVATGVLESGVELVLPDGKVFASRSWNGAPQSAGDALCPGQGAAIGGHGFGRAGMGAEVDPGIAFAALRMANGTGVSDVGQTFFRMAGKTAGDQCAGGGGDGVAGFPFRFGDATTGGGGDAAAGVECGGVSGPGGAGAFVGGF